MPRDRLECEALVRFSIRVIHDCVKPTSKLKELETLASMVNGGAVIPK